MYYNELYHYGIPGMKWGVRRFQNANGTYTPLGARRHSSGVSGVSPVRGSPSRPGRRKIDKRKLARNIAIGASTAAALGGAAYGIHRLRKSGKLDDYAAKGREVIGNARSKVSSNQYRYANNLVALGAGAGVSAAYFGKRYPKEMKRLINRNKRKK